MQGTQPIDAGDSIDAVDIFLFALNLRIYKRLMLSRISLTCPMDLSEPGCGGILGDGSHLADESVVAVAFYNVGIPNKELMGTKWKKQDSSKKVRLKADIQATLGADVGIQAVFISEFGQMYPNIDEFVPDMTNVFLRRCFATLI